MLTITPKDTYEEILDTAEARTPMMVLGIDVDEATVGYSERTVRVTIFDNLTCNEIGSWEVDPFSALHLLHKASFCSIDGERLDVFDTFTQELYSMVNAWAERLQADTVVTRVQAPAPMTCKLSDVLDFTATALARDGHCDVTIDGAHWRVMP